jgi:hypothetical protein
MSVDLKRLAREKAYGSDWLNTDAAVERILLAFGRDVLKEAEKIVTDYWSPTELGSTLNRIRALRESLNGGDDGD